MERILWIGPRPAPQELRTLLAARGAEVHGYASVREALTATPEDAAGVAVVSCELPNVADEIQHVLTARPQLLVVAASDASLPRPVLLSLWAGATGLVDVKAQTRAEIALRLQECLTRQRLAMQERALLLKVRALNEEFLKNLVASEKRNLELEEKLEEPAPASPDEGPPRILIVDDEQVVCDVLELVVQRKGYGYAIALNAEAALEHLERQRFHLVLTDKNLPKATGLALLQQVRTRWPQTDVVLMTGYSSTESAIEALNLGASGYLVKPFEHIRDVVEKIEEVLARQRERVKNQLFLRRIKERQRSFLEQYRAVRSDLDAYLVTRGVRKP